MAQHLEIFLKTFNLVQETARLSVCGQYSGRVILNNWLPLRVSMCASAWTRQGPRGLPSPRIFMFLGGMKASFGARGKRRGFSPGAAAHHLQYTRVYTEFP